MQRIDIIASRSAFGLETEPLALKKEYFRSFLVNAFELTNLSGVLVGDVGLRGHDTVSLASTLSVPPHVTIEQLKHSFGQASALLDQPESKKLDICFHPSPPPIFAIYPIEHLRQQEQGDLWQVCSVE